MPTNPPEARRPHPVALLIVLLYFLGITATAGGVQLIVNAFAPPLDWLDEVPFISTWLIPGLVLGVGFGFGSLVTATGMLKRWRWPWLTGFERTMGHHWSWAAALAIGIGHLVWIGLELAYLPEPSVLQAIFGAIGLAITILPLVPSAQRFLAVGT